MDIQNCSKKGILGFLLLWSFCWSASLAEESDASVASFLVVAKPVDAQVYLETSGRRRYEEYLGEANEDILIDLTRYKQASGLNIVLKRRGYFDKSERISIDYLRSRDRYPEFGAIRLEPHNSLIPILLFLERHKLAVGLSFCFVLGGYWFRRRSASRAPTPDSPLELEIGGFQLKELIGVGGSAKVYRAVRTEGSSEQVAVKIFREEILSSDDFLERFRREADVCRGLQHKGIVPLLDWGTSNGGTPYLVTEFVDGQTLARLCDGKPQPSETVLDYLEQAAEALAYAHQQGIVHRDVKPDNFLVNENGQLKLMDFGLARQILSSFTKTGHALGTPAFMSPEQIKGEFLDHRSDQYSLGAMGYQLITGKRPFVDEETEAAPVLFKQLNSEPTAMADLVDGVPKVVERLVRKLMSRSPADRFASMNEVLEAIKKAQVN